jgi:diguanylate cyclase (GGDEF)-like protein
MQGVIVSDQIVGLINPGMSLIFAAGGFALWLRDRSLNYVLGYVLAAVLIGFSFAINQYSQNAGTGPVQMLVGALSIAAVISLVWSMCHRLGQATPLGLWLGIGAAAVAVVGLADHGRDVTASLLAVNLACGVVMVMGTQIMAQSPSRQFVDRLLVWIFGLAAAQFFIRPLAVVMLGGAMSTAAYRGSAGHAVLVVTAAIFTLALTGAILAATISDQIRAVKQAVRKDELSGLLRRSVFEEQADAIIARARAEGRSVSMVLADLDHFKQINDRQGHPAGDAVIRAFGGIIAGAVRPTDLAGRIGGEEFGVLAWDCPEQPAANLAERLRSALAADPVEAFGAQLALTASFGVAELRPGETYDELYARADAALYRAKRQGRDAVVVDGDDLPPVIVPLAQAGDPPRGKTGRAGSPRRRGQVAGLGKGAAIAQGA